MTKAAAIDARSLDPSPESPIEMEVPFHVISVPFTKRRNVLHPVLHAQNPFVLIALPQYGVILIDVRTSQTVGSVAVSSAQKIVLTCWVADRRFVVCAGNTVRQFMVDEGALIRETFLLQLEMPITTVDNHSGDVVVGCGLQRFILRSECELLVLQEVGSSETNQSRISFSILQNQRIVIEDHSLCFVDSQENALRKHELLVLTGVGEVREAVAKSDNEFLILYEAGSQSFASAMQESASLLAESPLDALCSVGNAGTSGSSSPPLSSSSAAGGLVCCVFHDGDKLQDERISLDIPFPSMMCLSRVSADFIFISSCASRTLSVMDRFHNVVSVIHHGLQLRGICCVGNCLVLCGFKPSETSAVFSVTKQGKTCPFCVMVLSLVTLEALIAPSGDKMKSFVEEMPRGDEQLRSTIRNLESRMMHLETAVESQNAKMDAILELLLKSQAR
eukprot:ANDGO_07889.mRNA.1 hypothetical protein